MNNLHRELAPISAGAWAQIDQEASVVRSYAEWACASARARHAGSRRHAIERTTPPSTRMAAPVVAEACSEAR
jgi:hypothetical protein